MQLGIVTYQIAADLDLTSLIELCQQTHMAGFELRTTHAHGVEPTLSRAERAAVREQIADSGVLLWGLGSVCEYDSPDAAVVKRNIDETARFVELARDLGARGVKVRPNRLHEQQGVAVAGMPGRDRDQPRDKVFKWHRGRWTEPGIGGHVTPIFPAMIDWHRADADAFWGPSIHWNTHLNVWVMLLNRAKDKDWAQEGIYISFNRSLSDPAGWTKPVKILDAGELEKSRWYPQVVGTDAAKRETDKLAGKTARLFVAGLSKWEIIFLRPGEQHTQEQ